MQLEERSWWSPNLGQDIALKVYGHAGRPVVAFPSQDGRYWDFESWGMVDACAGLIDADGCGSWRSTGSTGRAGPTSRSIRPRAASTTTTATAHEVAPFVCELTGMERAWTTGASMGAYHAANVLFRHPDLFDGLIALSGLYRLRHFIGDYVDDGVYFNSPLLYLPGLEDPRYLDRIREARLAFVVGQGAWEDEMLEDTREMRRILEAKAIPAIVDEWARTWPTTGRGGGRCCRTTWSGSVSDAHARESQALIDSLWDFDDPVTSERRFREAAQANPALEAALRTQVARALAAGAVRRGVAVLDDLPPTRPSWRCGWRSSGAGSRTAAVILEARPLFEQACAGAQEAGLENSRGRRARTWWRSWRRPTSRRRSTTDRAGVGADDPRARQWLASLLNNAGWTRFDAGDLDGALSCSSRARRT